MLFTGTKRMFGRPNRLTDCFGIGGIIFISSSRKASQTAAR